MTTFTVTLTRAEIIKAVKDAARNKAALLRMPTVIVRDFDLDTIFAVGIPETLDMLIDISIP